MRKILGIVLSVAILASFFSITSKAYFSGDREIKYYNFALDTDETAGATSDSMLRRYNREWVITVSSRANNSYPITYGILWNNTDSWSWAITSNTTSKQGVGNFGGTYFNANSIGMYLYLGIKLDSRDLNHQVSSNGQWSTDAAN